MLVTEVVVFNFLCSITPKQKQISQVQRCRFSSHLFIDINTSLSGRHCNANNSTETRGGNFACNVKWAAARWRVE